MTPSNPSIRITVLPNGRASEVLFTALVHHEDVFRELQLAFNGKSDEITAIGIRNGFFVVECGGILRPIASIDEWQLPLLKQVLYEDLPNGNVMMENSKPELEFKFLMH